MEIYAHLVDWEKFQAKYRPGDIDNGNTDDWAEPLESAEPCELGSANGAMVDAFQLMQPHLPEDVRKAIGTLTVSIATLVVEGWSQDDCAPSAISEFPVYSPDTVRKVLSTFDAVELARIKRLVSIAWAKMSTDPKDWQYVDVGYWTEPDEFIEYLLD
jgi:hypothetical protein